jgi:hypothetical protein
MERPRRLVGEVINFRSVLYAPVYRHEVYPLFMTVAADLQMLVEPVRPPFHRGRMQRRSGEASEQLRVLFAVRSRDLQRHLVMPTAVDLVIFWRDDWPDCPVGVLPLEPLTRPGALGPRRRPSPAPRPAAVPRAHELPGLGDALAARTPLTRQLFHRLDQAIRTLSPDILVKVTRGHRHQGGLSYASPERVFIYVKFQIRHGLSLDVFTRDQAWPGVTPLAAQRWGALRVRTEDELVRAMEVAKRSYGAIKAAIARGERTGMRAVREHAARARQPSRHP